MFNPLSMLSGVGTIFSSLKVLLIAGAVIAAVAQLHSIRKDAGKAAALEFEVREVARVVEVNRERSKKADAIARVAREAERTANGRVKVAEAKYTESLWELEALPKKEVGICDLRCVLPSSSE